MPDYDPFVSDEDEDEGEKTTGKEDNKSFQELRKAYNRISKEKKDSDKELEELRTFRTTVVEEKKEAAAKAVFVELGLNPQHAKLFKALNPGLEAELVSAETVAEFAKEYGLLTPDSELEEDDEKTASRGFTPAPTGSPVQTGQFTLEDINKMLKAGDYEAVNKAYKSGRVQKQDRPWKT